MTTKPRRSSLLLLPSLAISLFALCCLETRATAATPEHWVGTWATSPYAAINRTDASGTPQFGAADTTYREIVHVSIGGERVRVVLSNAFGTVPLVVGAAHVVTRAAAARAACRG